MYAVLFPNRNVKLNISFFLMCDALRMMVVFIRIFNMYVSCGFRYISYKQIKEQLFISNNLLFSTF